MLNLNKINNWNIDKHFISYMYIILYLSFQMFYNYIGGVMVSLLASSAVDRGFKPRLSQAKTIKLAFVASPLITQH
jgi:hypothetical protein